MKPTVSGKRRLRGPFARRASPVRPATRSLAVLGLALCLAAPLMAGGGYQAPAAPRRIAQTINREWTFNYFPAGNADSAGCQAPDFDDSAWPAIAVPHTWSTYETTGEVHPYIRNASEKNSTYWWYGWGWYRKHVVIEKTQAGGKVFVEFDGVQKYCKVWLNGHYVGDHKGGFHSFYFDLTDHVRFGEDNVLVVAVNNRQTDPFHIPVMDAGNWDIYGGIYRNVRLVLTDRLYVPFQGSYKHEGGTFITATNVSTAEARLCVKTWVKNDYPEPKDCELTTVIADAEGKLALTLKSKKTIQPGELAQFIQTNRLANPQLWSPEAPHLYTAHSEVRTGGKVVDRFDSPFGVRSVRWQFADRPENNVLFVNEKPVNLQGFCRHQEYPWVGDAQPRWMQETDLRDMKENLNCNFFRSGHYTTDRAVYDYCDRNGLMVVEDVPNVKDKDFSREVQEQQVREMIRRDRNRPSIFAWSMGDESNKAADSKWAHEEDTTRYIHARDCPGPSMGDFISLPAKNLRMGRLMSCTIRGWYDRDEWSFEPKNHQSTSNEERQHQAYIAGNDSGDTKAVRIGNRNMIVWLYEDHGCSRTYQNEPVLNINPKGWVDCYRFPKYAYYLWQANHIVEPMVFIHPHFWRSAYLGQSKDFIVDSNCDTVELKINGKSLGVLKPSAANLHVVTFKDVPVQAGTLSAEGRKDGKIVVNQVAMAGEPARIVLTASHQTLEAALDSVAIIKADIPDANGAHVYGATNTILWSIEGPATLVGAPVYETDIGKNMELDGTMYIDMPVANVIRSTGKPGEVKVRLQAAGLAMGEVSLLVERPAQPAPGPILQPLVAGGMRQPVKRHVTQAVESPAPQELKEASDGLQITIQGVGDGVAQVSKWLAEANPRVDTKNPEFAVLARVLARQLSLNGGKLSAQDFAFNAAHYNLCRQWTSLLDATTLPPRFKEDLRTFYCEEIIARANHKSFQKEKEWITKVPANAVLVLAGGQGGNEPGKVSADPIDVSEIVAQVRAEFNKLGAEEKEAALTRLCTINPLICRHQLVTGDRKQGNVQRVVTFTARPGAALLVPEMGWLLAERPAQAKQRKTK
jgi:beta-galactosidase